MADKMEVDAVVADKQVEASGPAPEKAPERSTYNRAAIALHDQVLTACHSHNRQLRPPRTSRRDLRCSLHPPRAALHLHHPQGKGLSDRHPHSHPHRLPQFEQPGEESVGRTPPAKCRRDRRNQGREGNRRGADSRDLVLSRRVGPGKIRLKSRTTIQRLTSARFTFTITSSTRRAPTSAISSLRSSATSTDEHSIPSAQRPTTTTPCSTSNSTRSRLQSSRPSSTSDRSCLLRYDLPC